MAGTPRRPVNTAQISPIVGMSTAFTGGRGDVVLDDGPDGLQRPREFEVLPGRRRGCVRQV